MARNLRNKIAANDELVIHDVNAQATARFKDELGNAKNVHIAGDVKQVAEQSVSPLFVPLSTSNLCDDTVLSMI